MEELATASVNDWRPPTAPCQICGTILTETYAVQFGDGLSDGLLVITCERCFGLLQVVREATSN